MQTTIILVLLFLPVADYCAGNLSRRLHTRGSVVLVVGKASLVECFLELHVGALPPVDVAGGGQHPLQLLDDLFVMLRWWFTKLNTCLIQLVSIGVSEVLQPKVVNLEAWLVVPDPLVPLLVAQVKSLGIIRFFQSVQDGVEGPFLMSLLCTLWMVPRHLSFLDAEV